MTEHGWANQGGRPPSVSHPARLTLSLGPLRGRLERLKQQYATKGIRHSVDALPIVYEHGHPHVLIFQIGMSYFKLPGGRLRPGESDHDGLLRKLDTNLAPDDAKLKPDWRIGTSRVVQCFCFSVRVRRRLTNVLARVHCQVRAWQRTGGLVLTTCCIRTSRRISSGRRR